MYAAEAELDPGCLDVVDVARIGEPTDGMHQDRLAEGGAAPTLVLEVDRRGHVDEGQRHELGEPARLALQRPGADDVAGPRVGLLDGAEHDRDVGAETDPVGRAVGVEPLVGGDLVGAEDGADVVVEDLGRGARQRLEPGIHEAPEVVGERFVEPLGALGDLECGEAVDVDVGSCFLHRSGDVDVVVAVEVGMDAALEADLGRAHLDRLDGSGPRCRRA